MKEKMLLRIRRQAFSNQLFSRRLALIAAGLALQLLLLRQVRLQGLQQEHGLGDKVGSRAGLAVVVGPAVRSRNVAGSVAVD